MKKKKTKVVIAIIVVLFVLICIFAGVALYINHGLKLTSSFLNDEVCDNGNIPCETTTFIVDEGAYGSETLDKLEQQGIINNASIVNYWNRMFYNYDFYAGQYELPHRINGEQINLEQLLAFLSNASNSRQNIRLVKLDEGDFAKSFAYEIAESVSLSDCFDDSTDAKANALIEYWNNEDVIRGYMNEYPFLTEDIFNEDAKILLEGYLFPDSYEFFENTSLDDVTRKILDRTLDVYNKHISEFNNSKLSIHEIFTLASIVQWETGNPEDSLIVAGAFLNRLENPEHEWIGGRLQSTVTACYAFDLSKDMCDYEGDSVYYTERYSPYNTYVIEGFPPGPVCCPNEIAINAALNPDQESGYYFFVANMCDGGTAFARTYDEHIDNIDRYYLPCTE